MNELGLTEEQFNDLPEEARTKYARLKADQLIDREDRAARDSSRLHMRQMAVYKKLGLDVDDVTQSDEMRVLGDNNTFNFGPGDSRVPIQPAPQEPEPEPSSVGKWVMPALVTLAIGAGAGGGALLHRWLNPPVSTESEDTDTRRVIKALP